jgi:hypothetical protein
MENYAVAITAASVNKDTEAWQRALESEIVLQKAITQSSGSHAGWAKLPVVLVYELLGRASFLALAHFLKVDNHPRILNHQGLATIECAAVFDEEVSGQENIDLFKSFWSDENVPSSALSQLGFKVHHPSVTLISDNKEPLLRLADVVAGLVHSACIPEPGRIAMPLSCTKARQLLEPLQTRGLLAVDVFDYEASYDQIFGSAMAMARNVA